MSFGKKLVQTRKKMRKMIVWLVLLLVAEMIILPQLIVGVFNLPNLVGPATLATMLATFIGAFWLGNRITDPLLEAGGDLVEQALIEKSKGS